MKVRIRCFKISKILVCICLIIIMEVLWIGIGMLRLQEEKNLVEIPETISEVKKESVGQKIEEPETILLQEYVRIPKEQKGFKVIGKIQIPKLNLDSYILEQTNAKALKVSVTKLYGPTINTVGNFCIAGHNYRNNKMFGGIKKLEIGDKIILTDTFDRSIEYQVYEKYNTNPKDVSCLEQDTKGEREVTLITCTAGAIQRVIVKAVEIYD